LNHHGKLRKIQIVLIGFLKNLALHLGRSPSIHSYGYGFSGDSPSCLASFPRNSDSFMQLAGWVTPPDQIPGSPKGQLTNGTDTITPCPVAPGVIAMILLAT
jgi:hypothetical protein